MTGIDKIRAAIEEADSLKKVLPRLLLARIGVCMCLALMQIVCRERGDYGREGA